MTNDDESEHPPTGSVIGLQGVGVESLEQEATVEATEKTSQPSDGFSMLFSVPRLVVELRAAVLEADFRKSLTGS